MKSSPKHFQENAAFYALLFMPIVWVGVFLAIDLNLYPYPETSNIFLWIQKELTKLAWLLAGFLGASKFLPGEYLRKTWLLYTILPICAILFDVVLLLAGIPWVQSHMGVIRGGFSTIGNILGTIAVIMLAGAWKVAGINLPGSRWTKVLLIITTTALAVAILGPGMLSSYKKIIQGDYLALNELAPALGDSISLIFLAPLFLTVLALRGSLTNWPWILFTIGLAGWLLTDLAYSTMQGSDMNPRVVRTWTEIFRCLASAYTFAAGYAQRLVIVKIRKNLGDRPI